MGEGGVEIFGLGGAQAFLGHDELHEIADIADDGVFHEGTLYIPDGEATGLPVSCENDGNAAAIAELFYGVGRRLEIRRHAELVRNSGTRLE